MITGTGRGDGIAIDVGASGGLGECRGERLWELGRVIRLLCSVGPGSGRRGRGRRTRGR
jgi:hypothetical protein